MPNQTQLFQVRRTTTKKKPPPPSSPNTAFEGVTVNGNTLVIHPWACTRSLRAGLHLCRGFFPPLCIRFFKPGRSISFYRLVTASIFWVVNRGNCISQSLSAFSSRFSLAAIRQRFRAVCAVGHNVPVKQQWPVFTHTRNVLEVGLSVPGHAQPSGKVGISGLQGSLWDRVRQKNIVNLRSPQSVPPSPPPGPAS